MSTAGALAVGHNGALLSVNAVNGYTGSKGRVRLYKVIIVDDAPFARKALLEQINWSGMGFGIVVEAHDAAAGLRAYHAHRPHVVIAEVQLPDMDGLAMVERMRQRDFGASFIIYTDDTEFYYIQRAIELHVQAYLQKPAECNKLQAILLDIVQAMERK